MSVRLGTCSAIHSCKANTSRAFFQTGPLPGALRTGLGFSSDLDDEASATKGAYSLELPPYLQDERQCWLTDVASLVPGTPQNTLGLAHPGL